MYIVIERAITAAGTAQQMTEKATWDESVMGLHQVMASAMANASVQSALCMVIDGMGNTLKKEYWERGNVAE